MTPKKNTLKEYNKEITEHVDKCVNEREALKASHKELLEALTGFMNLCPEDGEKSVCMLCDMGEAGYSSRGRDTHDDQCPYVDGKQAILNAQKVDE